MMRLTTVGLLLLSCLAAPVWSREPPKPQMQFRADLGTMYAGRTEVELTMLSIFDEDSRPQALVTIWFNTEGDTGTRSSSDSYDDLTPLIDALKEARGHLAKNDAWMKFIDGPPPCASRWFAMEGSVYVGTLERRVRITLKEHEAVEFDADEVDYFLKMLEPAQALMVQLKPRIDAFNAAGPPVPGRQPRRPAGIACGASPARATDAKSG